MPSEHYSDARGATTPDAVQELLQFVREAQAALDQPSDGEADPALAHTSRTVLQSRSSAPGPDYRGAGLATMLTAWATRVIRLDGHLRILAA